MVQRRRRAHQHGFLDTPTISGSTVVSNNFITIDVPGSLGPLGSTEPLSINNSGHIVGFYRDNGGGIHGFGTDVDQALTTTSEAFNHTAGAGVSTPVDLGNTISNDSDPNTGGLPISFQGFESASFESQTGFTVAFQGNVITITDSLNQQAKVTVDASGEESLSDPHNIFAALNGSIVLDVGYTIKDNLGVLAQDSQTITIGGVPQGNPFPSDLSNLVLYLQNSQGSIEKVIFQNGAQLQFKTDSDISTWINDYSTGANDILHGYTTLDAFTYHADSNNEAYKTLANLPTNTQYFGPSDFPLDNKSKLVIDLQNHSVDTPLWVHLSSMAPISTMVMPSLSFKR